MTSKPLLQALAGKRLSVPPIWLMRQAGRYLPEYRALRAKAGDFLTLCYNPDLATEITLQPLQRYDFDAAILFADILLIAQALGRDLTFIEGVGPRLTPIDSAQDIAALRPVSDIHDTLAPIYQTIRNLAAMLPPDKALIGFAGAPWTVATYVIAGQGTADQKPARTMLANEPVLFAQLIAHLTEATIAYLKAQIAAGAEVVKLFDSWAGALTGEAFADFIVSPTRTIIAALKRDFPHIPVIVFPRGAEKQNYIPFCNDVGADCCALDSRFDPLWAADNFPKGTVLQGNLDPIQLLQGGDRLIRDVKLIKSAFAGRAHIFNLGHGVLPQTPPENVAKIIEILRGA